MILTDDPAHLWVTVVPRVVKREGGYLFLLALVLDPSKSVEAVHLHKDLSCIQHTYLISAWSAFLVPNYARLLAALSALPNPGRPVREDPTVEISQLKNGFHRLSPWVFRREDPPMMKLSNCLLSPPSLRRRRVDWTKGKLLRRQTEPAHLQKVAVFFQLTSPRFATHVSSSRSDSEAILCMAKSREKLRCVHGNNSRCKCMNAENKSCLALRG